MLHGVEDWSSKLSAYSLGSLLRCSSAQLRIVAWIFLLFFLKSRCTPVQGTRGAYNYTAGTSVKNTQLDDLRIPLDYEIGVDITPGEQIRGASGPASSRSQPLTPTATPGRTATPTRASGTATSLLTTTGGGQRVKNNHEVNTLHGLSNHKASVKA